MDYYSSDLHTSLSQNQVAHAFDIHVLTLHLFIPVKKSVRNFILQ